MKFDSYEKGADYFPTEVRLKTGRSYKRKDNILQQFQRKSPSIHFRKEPQKKQSQKINSSSTPSLKPLKEKPIVQDDSIKIKHYHEDYMGIIRMSDSIQRNKIELNMKRTRRKYKLNTTRSTEHYRLIGMPTRLEHKPSEKSNNSIRDNVSPARYSSLDRQLPSFHVRSTQTLRKKQLEDATFKKVLQWYSQQIELYVKLAENSAERDDSVVSEIWSYRQYLMHREKFERLLMQLREVAKKSNKTINLIVLQGYLKHIRLENEKVQEVYRNILYNQDAKATSNIANTSRKAATNLLTEEIRQINASETISPMDKNRLNILEKCQAITEHMRTSKFIKYFQNEFFS